METEHYRRIEPTMNNHMMEKIDVIRVNKCFTKDWFKYQVYSITIGNLLILCVSSILLSQLTIGNNEAQINLNRMNDELDNIKTEINRFKDEQSKNQLILDVIVNKSRIIDDEQGKILLSINNLTDLSENLNETLVSSESNLKQLDELLNISRYKVVNESIKVTMRIPGGTTTFIKDYINSTIVWGLYSFVIRSLEISNNIHTICGVQQSEKVNLIVDIQNFQPGETKTITLSFLSRQSSTDYINVFCATNGDAEINTDLLTPFDYSGYSFKRLLMIGIN